MRTFLGGILTCAYWVAGLFFWRFWKSAHDRLFLAFASAFWMLAVERIIVEIWSPDELSAYVYLIRLVAFLLIIYGIADKNRQR